MLTLEELTPGTIVRFGRREKEVKRVVRHPAGPIIQWKGHGEYAQTHNSFDYLRESGARVVRP